MENKTITTLFKNGPINFYKVELEEIRSTDKDGHEFSSVLMNKYCRRGDHWMWIDKYLYSEWTMKRLIKYYIEYLNYYKGE